MWPASPIACVCNASASVSVDLPASGWEITANARRRAAWAGTSSCARAAAWMRASACGRASTVRTWWCTGLLGWSDGGQGAEVAVVGARTREEPFLILRRAHETPEHLV